MLATVSPSFALPVRQPDDRFLSDYFRWVFNPTINALASRCLYVRCHPIDVEQVPSALVLLATVDPCRNKHLVNSIYHHLWLDLLDVVRGIGHNDISPLR